MAEKSKTAEVLKEIYLPVFIASFFGFLLIQYCGINIKNVSAIFIQTIGFGIALGNMIQKLSVCPKAAWVPGVLGFVIFCGLFGIHWGGIAIAGKSLPLQAWLSIALGVSVGFAMGKGGL